jgi:hypothetical protein
VNFGRSCGSLGQRIDHAGCSSQVSACRSAPAAARRHALGAPRWGVARLVRSPCQGVFRKRRCYPLSSADMEHEYVCDRQTLCLHCNTQIYDLQGRRVRCLAPAAAGSDMGANGTSNPLDFDELTEIIRRAVLTAALLARLTHPMSGRSGGV